MNEIQAKKDIFGCGKYVLIFVALVFVIGAGILVYLKNRKESTPIPPKEEIQQDKPQEKPTPAPIPTPPEEKWETYSSIELGFSIKYPEMVYGTNDCIDRGSTEKEFYVPMRVFEDNKDSVFYITPEYCYHADRKWDPVNLTTQVGLCEKITYSLELLQNEWRSNVVLGGNKPFSLQGKKTFLGWGILIENIKNESELNKFIKNNYGPGCFVEKKEPWKQDGVYEIEIKGEDWDNGTTPGDTSCPWSVAYKILYAPQKNKIISINLGQECTFAIITDPNRPSWSYECYDEKMIDSLRFE